MSTRAPTITDATVRSALPSSTSVTMTCWLLASASSAWASAAGMSLRSMSLEARVAMRASRSFPRLRVSTVRRCAWSAGAIWPMISLAVAFRLVSSLRLTASNRSWALRTSWAASAVAADTAWRTSPSATWPKRMVPMIAVTRVPRSIVVTITRSRREERHQVRTPPAACAGVLMASVRPCLVTHTADRQHDLGVLRVLLDLRAQPLDVHVHQARDTGVPVSPHLLQQRLAVEDVVGSGGEGDQQIELKGGQRQLGTLPLDGVPGDIDRQVPDSELGWLAPVAAAQARPDPGQQLLGLEGLHDIVVGTGLQAGHHVLGVGPGGEHHDRDARLGPQVPAYLHPVEGGQHHVKQHQVRAELTKERHGPSTVRAVGHLQALLAQHDAEHLGQCLVVIDHQYACVHVSPQ